MTSDLKQILAIDESKYIHGYIFISYLLKYNIYYNFIYNLMKHSKLAHSIVTINSEVINGAFIWRHTEEGQDFWKDAYYKWTYIYDCMRCKPLNMPYQDRFMAMSNKPNKFLFYKRYILPHE